MVKRNLFQASPLPNKMAASGNDMKTNKVLCRGLARLFGLMRRGRKRALHKGHRRNDENQQLAVQFFTGGSDPDDETVSSSTISPTYAKVLHGMGVDDFVDGFPSRHFEDEISFDDDRLYEQNQRSRERGWTESSELSQGTVSPFYDLAVAMEILRPHNISIPTHLSNATSRKIRHYPAHLTKRGPVAKSAHIATSILLSMPW